MGVKGHSKVLGAQSQLLRVLGMNVSFQPLITSPLSWGGEHRSPNIVRRPSRRRARAQRSRRYGREDHRYARWDSAIFQLDPSFRAPEATQYLTERMRSNPCDGAKQQRCAFTSEMTSTDSPLAMRPS